MPSLMTALEDPDQSVREQAKEGVITLFSVDSGLPDAARQDLKAQLGQPKNGIRKATVDYILAKLAPRREASLTDVLSRASSSSSIATTSKVVGEAVDPIYIASARDLELEFAALYPPFEGKETEHNWQSREKATQRIRGASYEVLGLP
jgi:CLIP-associating protein 1/2